MAAMEEGALVINPCFYRRGTFLARILNPLMRSFHATSDADKPTWHYHCEKPNVTFVVQAAVLDGGVSVWVLQEQEGDVSDME